MEQTLGKRIVQKRKQLGLTQDALAEKLGVTPQAVSKWENDQSCPDITMLPRLAEIFGITTDALLGITEDIPTKDATVEPEENENNGIHYRNGNWEVKLDSSRRGKIAFAVFILLVGGLYLAISLLHLDISLWNIVWPSFILVYGLNAMMPKFSFFVLAAYSLADSSCLTSFCPVSCNWTAVWSSPL